MENKRTQLETSEEDWGGMEINGDNYRHIVVVVECQIASPRSSASICAAFLGLPARLARNYPKLGREDASEAPRKNRLNVGVVDLVKLFILDRPCVPDSRCPSDSYVSRKCVFLNFSEILDKTQGYRRSGCAYIRICCKLGIPNRIKNRTRKQFEAIGGKRAQFETNQENCRQTKSIGDNYRQLLTSGGI